jgi:hypothetical protein
MRHGDPFSGIPSLGHVIVILLRLTRQLIAVPSRRSH